MTDEATLLSFPTSDKKPDLMQILGFTNEETLLYDYSETESFYVLAASLAAFSSAAFTIAFDISTTNGTLFAVTSTFARSWYGLNGLNNLTIVYNPFLFRSTT